MMKQIKKNDRNKKMDEWIELSSVFILCARGVRRYKLLFR